MNLWACFFPQRGSRFGVHLDRVLSLPLFHLADFVPFLAAWSGSEAYGSVADVEAAPQLWARNVPLRGGRWRLAFVHGCVNFRASRDVKVRNCTEIRLCVCCSVFSAEFIAFFMCWSLSFTLWAHVSVFFLSFCQRVACNCHVFMRQCSGVRWCFLNQCLQIQEFTTEQCLPCSLNLLYCCWIQEKLVPLWTACSVKYQVCIWNLRDICIGFQSMKEAPFIQNTVFLKKKVPLNMLKKICTVIFFFYFLKW